MLLAPLPLPFMPLPCKARPQFLCLGVLGCLEVLGFSMASQVITQEEDKKTGKVKQARQDQGCISCRAPLCAEPMY